MSGTSKRLAKRLAKRFAKRFAKRLTLSLCLLASIEAGLVQTATAGQWRAQVVYAPARVNAIETASDAGGNPPRVNAGGLWYRAQRTGKAITLAFVDAVPPPKRPDGSLPDGEVVAGSRDIARVWFAEPTTRYDHGILGDKIEAGALVIEADDGKRHTVRLKNDAVFEDLTPRLVDLDGDGHDEVIVVKSYLKRGSALAVVALRKGRYDIVAETPPLGSPHRWLNPAGIADFTGDGKIDIALVRQPHVVGELELWGYANGHLTETATLPDTANHIAGARALHMSAVADFDGDGIADIAIPSLDRGRLRIVSFAPAAREIASVTLPAKIVTNLALIAGAPPAGTAATGAAASGTKAPPAILAGLADGSLVVIRND